MVVAFPVEWSKYLWGFGQRFVFSRDQAPPMHRQFQVLDPFFYRQSNRALAQLVSPLGLQNTVGLGGNRSSHRLLFV
ncbi:MAG: hypothetical protein EXS11_00260 [Gemmataceae bacterium]|nr:hypothetical protein [Gemmataceae bacterium]